MKIILSRKGFDSTSGGQPSPILPDGTLLSLPIPMKGDEIKFSELSYKGKSYLDIIKELNPNTKLINDDIPAHLDPDIRKDVYQPRLNDWKAIFGQSDGSLTHLIEEKVSIGDIFLFFGWFRQTKEVDGKLKYTGPDLHIIYGYLQIGEIYLNGDIFPEYSMNHPHLNEERQKLKQNGIYVAKDKLSFSESLSGANTLNYNKNLVLTKEGKTRSRWELPDFFKEPNITHHNAASFKDNYFQSVRRGQEFVIEENDKVTEWAKNLIENNQA